MPDSAPAGFVARPPRFDGGSEEDQQRLLELYHAFGRANDARDSEALRQIWSVASENVFFSSSGHTYYGLEDWVSHSKHHRSLFKAARPYEPGNISIVIRGDMAVLIGDRVVRHFAPIEGADVPPTTSPPFLRWTQVCLRQHGDWKVVHAHFSTGTAEPRWES